MNGPSGVTRHLSLIVALVACLLAGCTKENQAEKRSPDVKQGHDPRPALVSKAVGPVTKADQTAAQPERTGLSEDRLQELALANMISDWNQAETQFKGEELLRKQWEIERRAIKMGPGNSLLKFFEFLSLKGANDIRERVISEIGNEIFSKGDVEKAREWLLSVEDKKLREKLCYHAGTHHPAEGLKRYIEKFQPDDHCESAVLTGYCRNLVKSDPAAAVQTFMDLRPTNVTFDGLVTVMASLPPHADFAAISGDIPDDSKSIAKRSRSALLQSWATTKPEAAAQYIISNTTLASPEQMGVVVQVWCKSAPEAADSWIGALSGGAIKDVGTAALAKHWSANDPRKAWEYAAKVDNFQKRVDTATMVFKEWEKTDKPAATKAWLELFPKP